MVLISSLHCWSQFPDVLSRKTPVLRQISLTEIISLFVEVGRKLQKSRKL